MHSSMTCLTVAVCKPSGYSIAKLDVKGAFIQTEMSGTLVYIKSMGKLRDRVLEALLEMSKYVGARGRQSLIWSLT
jgi:hypothetical protein